MKFLSLLATCLVAIWTHAQISIIPQPASVKQPKIAAKFSISPSTQIVLGGSNLENIAGYKVTKVSQSSRCVLSAFA